jgi:hypothetical protein
LTGGPLRCEAAYNALTNLIVDLRDFGRSDEEIQQEIGPTPEIGGHRLARWPRSSAVKAATVYPHNTSVTMACVTWHPAQDRLGRATVFAL